MSDIAVTDRSAKPATAAGAAFNSDLRARTEQNIGEKFAEVLPPQRANWHRATEAQKVAAIDVYKNLRKLDPSTEVSLDIAPVFNSKLEVTERLLFTQKNAQGQTEQFGFGAGMKLGQDFQLTDIIPRAKQHVLSVQPAVQQFLTKNKEELNHFSTLPAARQDQLVAELTGKDGLRLPAENGKGSKFEYALSTQTYPNGQLDLVIRDKTHRNEFVAIARINRDGSAEVEARLPDRAVVPMDRHY